MELERNRASVASEKILPHFMSGLYFKHRSATKSPYLRNGAAVQDMIKVTIND